MRPVLADEPGVGKTSQKVNYDTPRNLSNRASTDAGAEGIALVETASNSEWDESTPSAGTARRGAEQHG